MKLNLFYITNNPKVAVIADKYGVDRIWIDLETLNKEQRQMSMNTVKSHHRLNDIKVIKPLLKNSKLLVRVNPINKNSEKEINNVIKAGADIIMLPMWKTVEEVKTFLNIVGKRTKTTLLLETKEAVECVDEILKLDFDEIHIGLNDLHLSYGLDFLFELLSNGVVDMLCEKFRKKNIPFGFGGIARLGSGTIDSENIIMEHYRLGSTRAILSRSFCDVYKLNKSEEIERLFKENLPKIREYENYCANVGEEEYKKNHQIVVEKVADVVKSLKTNKN